MARWKVFGKLDSQSLGDGDSRFVGVDMTRDRALLAPGFLARSENKRLRLGAASTRLGNVQPADFAPGFGNTLIGSDIYSNPNGDEVMLVAESGAFDGVAGKAYVWALQFGKDPYKVHMATGQSFGPAVLAVEFVQAFDKVIMLRRYGNSIDPLMWDGDKTHDFEVVTKPTGAIDKIPPNTQPGPGYTTCNYNGTPFQSRVLYYNTEYPILPWSYQFIASDVLEYGGYDPANRSFQVNAGEADQIVRIWPYFKDSVICFKRRSTHQFYNFAGTDATTAAQRQLSKRIGLCATRAVIEWGSDLAFLNEPGGVFKLGEIIQEQIASEPLPISEQIQDFINRINWPQARYWACAQALAEYGYFAVPIDGVLGGSNAIMVLNLTNGQWESVPDRWDDPSFLINALHVTQYRDGRAVYAVDYAAKKIYALYQQDAFDEVNDDIIPVTDLIETRGYTCQDAGSFKRYSRAGAILRTYDPYIKVTGISDGYNEEKDLTPKAITKDRLKFYPLDHDDFDPLTDDPDEPKREDYSAAGLLDNMVGEDYEGIPVGPVDSIPGTAPIAPGPRQTSREPLSVRVNARWLSLRVENFSGVCDVLATGVEATPSLMEARTGA